MRTSSPKGPLVLAFRSTLIALDRETGRHRWKASFPMQIRRFFAVDGAVLAVLAEPGVRGAVHAVDLATGMSHRSVALDFDPSGAAIVQDGMLFLASEHGVACVTTDCQLVWHGGVREVKRGLFGADPMLVITGADGSERTQLEVGHASHSGNAGMLLDDVVSQPDLRD